MSHHRRRHRFILTISEREREKCMEINCTKNYNTFFWLSNFLWLDNNSVVVSAIVMALHTAIVSTIFYILSFSSHSQSSLSLSSVVDCIMIIFFFKNHVLYNKNLIRRRRNDHSNDVVTKNKSFVYKILLLCVQFKYIMTVISPVAH